MFYKLSKDLDAYNTMFDHTNDFDMVALWKLKSPIPRVLPKFERNKIWCYDTCIRYNILMSLSNWGWLLWSNYDMVKLYVLFMAHQPSQSAEARTWNPLPLMQWLHIGCGLSTSMSSKIVREHQRSRQQSNNWFFTRLAFFIQLKIII